MPVREYLKQGVEQTVTVAGGLNYYYGGPDQSISRPKTDKYAASNMSMAAQGAPPVANNPFETMSDDELNQLYANSQHPAGAVPQVTGLDGLSDADLDNLYRIQQAKAGDGTVINAETRTPATDAQTEYFRQLMS